MSVVSVHNVTKLYRTGVGRARVREMLPWPFDRALSGAFPGWWNKNTALALNDVSLSVAPGMAMGLVGHNGAGKTTLLRVIAGVTSPNSGSVKVSGRMGTLLNVVGGFHSDLTGRENVLLLGTIYGLSRSEMAKRMRAILDFSEIDEYIDTPIKRYSSGMISRLGFGTLTALDIDLLLVDEVLAVGDSSFQRKCVEWLEQFRKKGGTLLFVSHNLGLVRNMTERAVWLDHGKVVQEGPTGEVLAAYARGMERRDAEGVSGGLAKHVMKARGHHRWGAGGARVAEVHIDEPEGPNREVGISIKFEAPPDINIVFGVGFIDERGRAVGSATSPPLSVNGDTSEVSCTIKPHPFRTGIYFPVVAIMTPDGIVQDRWRLDRAVVVDDDGLARVDEFGPVEIPAAWVKTSLSAQADVG